MSGASPSAHFDIAIVGAGPAGLSAAASAAFQNLSYILFEKGEVGNTIFEYQLKKHVMAEPNKLPLRSKIAFDAGSREKILGVWQDAIKELKINVCKAEVSAIKKNGETFEVRYGENSCTASKVILAIGMQGSPRKLGVPGDHHAHVAYTLSDPGAFQNKNIIVVGAGDASIENALALAQQNKVMLINRGSEFARAKDANAALILKAISSGKIKCFYDSAISNITPETTSITAPEGEVTVECGHIIARLGCIMPRKFLENCGIQFPNAEPTTPPKVSEYYESNVPGLFILGALIGYPLIKQAINQGFEVIQYITGKPVAPADQVLVEEKLNALPGGADANLAMIRKNLPLFEQLSTPQFRELITESTVHVPKKGDIIFSRNDYTDTFFSVVQGAAEVDLQNGNTTKIEQGDFFGEMGLLSGRRRSATVRAGDDCILLETPRKQMIKLISSVRSVKEIIDQDFVLRALQTSVFPDADPHSLQELAKKIEQKLVKKGDVIFKEGEPGNALYVIRKGSVKVARRNKQGKDIVQTYIPAGSMFGEMTLLAPENSTCSATVIAAVPCELLAIKRADAEAFFAVNPSARALITEVADRRRIENLTNEQNQETGAMLDFMFREGLSDAENVLVIDSNLCVSCDNCETACAATHSGYSRLDRKGGKSFASIQIPISCRHCENPLCMLDCPPDALTRLPNGEVVIRDSCIGCGNCVRNCPYGVIQMVYDKPASSGFSLFDLFRSKPKEKGPAKAAKCDLCEGLDGGPACVRACPTGAAIRVHPSQLLKIVTDQIP